MFLFGSKAIFYHSKYFRLRVIGLPALNTPGEWRVRLAGDTSYPATTPGCWSDNV
nr:MAG TPA_asm: cellulase [Caudoviricetes sp.]